MPALQVRDFPPELYEALKLSAEAEHRSMAQQTIALLDRSLHPAPTRTAPASPNPQSTPPWIPANEPRTLHLERIDRRTAILSRLIDGSEASQKCTIDSVSIVHECRNERSAELAERQETLER